MKRLCAFVLVLLAACSRPDPVEELVSLNRSVQISETMIGPKYLYASVKNTLPGAQFPSDAIRDQVRKRLSEK